jgi:hypothetical protein
MPLFSLAPTLAQLGEMFSSSMLWGLGRTWGGYQAESQYPHALETPRGRSRVDRGGSIHPQLRAGRGWDSKLPFAASLSLYWQS